MTLIETVMLAVLCYGLIVKGRMRQLSCYVRSAYGGYGTGEQEITVFQKLRH